VDIHNVIAPEDDLSDIVHVYDVSARGCKVYNDVANEHLVIMC
jgi:hypothetical protein